MNIWKNMTRVLAFGTFDVLHDGHIYFLNNAKKQGAHLCVVITRDEAVKHSKGQYPQDNEKVRLKNVKNINHVDEVLLGGAPNRDDPYSLLSTLSFNVIVLGYDQMPTDEVVKKELLNHGKENIRIVRLDSHKPEVYKSSLLKKNNGDDKSIFDLHLHSKYSDGDLSPSEIIDRLANEGVKGASITDHNGLWGTNEAKDRATELGLEYVEGIEVSARFENRSVHILGYSDNFNYQIMEKGLESVRVGMASRLKEMVNKCNQIGYEKINYELAIERKSKIKNPAYISYDLAIMLKNIYMMDDDEARRLTVEGGACHVPYGAWSLSPGEAIHLIRDAGGVAVLAHPGLMVIDDKRDILERLLNEVLTAGVEGIEVYHPNHNQIVVDELLTFTNKNNLVVTGGSDWHGPNRYRDSDKLFGKIGIERIEFDLLKSRIAK